METREITLTLPEDVYQELQAAAKATQRRTEAIVVDALRAYLPPLPPDLAEEFAAWDKLSDEALLEFEQRLEKAD